MSDIKKHVNIKTKIKISSYKTSFVFDNKNYNFKINIEKPNN